MATPACCLAARRATYGPYRPQLDGLFRRAKNGPSQMRRPERSAPANSRALRRIRGVIQRVVRGRSRSALRCELLPTHTVSITDKHETEAAYALTNVAVNDSL